MYKAFFDTNILAYEFDKSEHRKQALAVDLINKWRPSGWMIISTQVLQELYVVLIQKLKPALKEEIAEEIIRNYSKLDVVIVDASLILNGIGIKRKYKISFWDALIVAAARRAGCKILFTEDLSHGMKIAGIEIVNPFF
ncbi:MAG: PIN domain-containing protein [Candidatus Desulfofervidaceae bacterium]|nr:PIN domain-containing protein [Candidatus Desulfofervidaceae bacterium]